MKSVGELRRCDRNEHCGGTQIGGSGVWSEGDPRSWRVDLLHWAPRVELTTDDSHSTPSSPN